MHVYIYIYINIYKYTYISHKVKIVWMCDTVSTVVISVKKISSDNIIIRIQSLIYLWQHPPATTEYARDFCILIYLLYAN